MPCSSCGGGGARTIAAERAAEDEGLEFQAPLEDRPPDMYNPYRAHGGFCSEALNRATTAGDGGEIFERISCGCQPVGASINVGHTYVLHAAHAGIPVEAAAAALLESNPGSVNKLTALKTAILGMQAKGFLEGPLPDGWPVLPSDPSAESPAPEAAGEVA